MANLKNAKKAIKVQERRRLRNSRIKTTVRTLIKKVLRQIEAKEFDLIDENHKKAVSEIDKAVTKGVYHRNNGARKKSRLAKRVAQAKAAQ